MGDDSDLQTLLLLGAGIYAISKGQEIIGGISQAGAQLVPLALPVVTAINPALGLLGQTYAESQTGYPTTAAGLSLLNDIQNNIYAATVDVRLALKNLFGIAI